MKILMLYAHLTAPAPPAWYIARSFKRMGHEVVTLGPGCEVNTGNRNPYIAHGNYNFMDVVRKNEIDVCLEVESGGFDISWTPPMNIKKNVKVTYWGSDTHLKNIEYAYVQKKAHYTHSFFAQKKFVDKYGSCIWLPHACDPEIHNPEYEGQKPHDVTFVGHQHPSVHKARINLFNSLNRKFKLNIRQGIFLDKMALEFKKSKIVLNRSLDGDINMRFFEGLCSGSCLLTDFIPDMVYLGAERGKHYIGYNGDGQAINAIKSLLEDPERRAKVAEAGQEFVIANHTYDHRAKKFIDVVS